MPPRAKKSDIKDEEWEKFQPEIRKLYLTEDKSLKDLLTILSVSYGFRPSKAQLQWKLTQWRMTKKMITSEWKYVHHRIYAAAAPQAKKAGCIFQASDCEIRQLRRQGFAIATRQL
ncbi:hypothetical protein CGRA01v4_00147 [Colletotrichum graminicola]|nr:hypothetical protein CGRA01v4_00147 [Colletotrichum graminicola]